MFIQSAPAGRPHRAIMMHEHGALSGQFARAFGNAQFEPPMPLDLVVYAIAHHDAGWLALDRDPATDPKTGLPYSVFASPPHYIRPTSTGSPDFNQRHHPFCGLLSSMHTWGIYYGRYGDPGAGRLHRTASEDRPMVEAMLTGERERQAAITAALAQAPQTAGYVEPAQLAHSYKLLQFCDQLAIYFNYAHPEHRKEHTLPHVPVGRGRDVSVSIRPKSPGVYAMSPFPFAADGAEFGFAGQALWPGQHERDGGWPAVLARAPTEWETFRLVAD